MVIFTVYKSYSSMKLYIKLWRVIRLKISDHHNMAIFSTDANVVFLW
jgi:hypothetical protein